MAGVESYASFIPMVYFRGSVKLARYTLLIHKHFKLLRLSIYKAEDALCNLIDY